MDDLRVRYPKFLHRDGFAKLHCDRHGLCIELHMCQKLKSGGKFLASHAVAL